MFSLSPLRLQCPQTQTQTQTQAQSQQQTAAQPFTQHSLTWALSSGQHNTAVRLITQGILVQVEDRDGLQPIHYAAEGGLLDLLPLLTQHGADINAAASSDGSTPLHRACSAGHFAAARWLLQHGADSTSRDALGQTPLHRAVLVANAPLVDLLSLDGAALHLADDDGLTPLHYAARVGDCQMRDESAKNASLNEPESHSLRILALLLSRGARPDAVDSCGETPLHEAVGNENQSVSAVQLLLRHGADPNSPNEDGQTALHLAALHARKDIFLTLVRAGARLDLVDYDNRTPMQLLPVAWRYDILQSMTNAKPTQHAPTLHLSQKPIAPLRAQVSLLQRPSDMAHVFGAPIQPGFVTEFPADSNQGVVVVAKLLDQCFRPVDSSSDAPHMTGAVQKLVCGRALFDKLVINIPSHGLIYHLQFFAFEYYGTNDQTLLGFSERVPIVLVESLMSKRDALLRQIWADAVPHNNTASWTSASASIQRQLANLLGNQERPLSQADLDYLRTRCASAMEATNGDISRNNLAELCWSWAYDAVHTITSATGALAMWNQGAIQGFLTREAAEALLLRCSEQTVLVRLSDTDASSFALGYVAPGTRTVVWAKVGADQLSDNHNLADIIAQSNVPYFLDAQGMSHNTHAFLSQFRKARDPQSNTPYVGLSNDH